MGEAYLSRTGSGDGAKIGDIRISTRSSLGEKWALCNGDIAPTDIAADVYNIMNEDQWMVGVTNWYSDLVLYDYKNDVYYTILRTIVANNNRTDILKITDNDYSTMDIARYLASTGTDYETIDACLGYDSSGNPYIYLLCLGSDTTLCLQTYDITNDTVSDYTTLFDISTDPYIKTDTISIFPIGTDYIGVKYYPSITNGTAGIRVYSVSDLTSYSTISLVSDSSEITEFSLESYAISSNADTTMITYNASTVNDGNPSYGNYSGAIIINNTDPTDYSSVFNEYKVSTKYKAQASYLPNKGGFVLAYASPASNDVDTTVCFIADGATSISNTYTNSDGSLLKLFFIEIGEDIYAVDCVNGKVKDTLGDLSNFTFASGLITDVSENTYGGFYNPRNLFGYHATEGPLLLLSTSTNISSTANHGDTNDNDVVIIQAALPTISDTSGLNWFIKIKE